MAAANKPSIDVAAGILTDDLGRVLIAQRPEGTHQAGWWEFPGGKIAASESSYEGLVREFAEEIAKIFEIELQVDDRPMPPDDPKVRKPDISRAKEVLGWEPAVPFDQGIRETIDYFRSVV